MNTANERIRYLRKVLEGMTLEKFGERLGVGKSAISDIERGRNNPTGQMIKSICREFGVSEDWLRTGNGEPYAPLTLDEEIARMIRETQTGPPDSLKLQMLSALAKMPDDDVKAIFPFAELLTNKDA